MDEIDPNDIVGGGTLATWWCIAKKTLYQKTNSIGGWNKNKIK